MASVAHGKFSGRRLVIAGCGYVGTAVAERMLAEGAAVTAITRNAAAAAALRAGGIETVVADLASDAWHGSIPTAPDFVLNCVSAGGGGAEGYRHSYLEGMQSLMRWAQHVGGVGTLVYTSSTSVYPQGGGAVVTEKDSESERQASPPLSETAEILRAAEAVLADSVGACRRWFILRLAGIYGPGRHYLLEQVRSGLVAGNGAHRLNLAHRDDIAGAICTCFAAPSPVANEIFNVADETPTPKAEVVAWLAGRLGVPVPTFSGVPAGSRRAVTPDRIIANGKAKSVLGWTPQYPSFREGYGAILARPT